jgi:6-phosphogluconate dehydrogenase
MWTSQSAMDLQVPLPVIDAAVAMRNLSGLEAQRREANGLLAGAVRPPPDRNSPLLASLPRALHAAMIVTYAQGMALLAAASEKYAYGLDLETVSRIWRGGCIIRSALLEDMRAAYRRRPRLANLLLDPDLATKIGEGEDALRQTAIGAVALGLPAPGFMAALGYLDAFRSPWLPANLIQAQRDFFGAHTYERIDAKGFFHTQWEKA